MHIHRQLRHHSQLPIQPVAHRHVVSARLDVNIRSSQTHRILQQRLHYAYDRRLVQHLSQRIVQAFYICSDHTGLQVLRIGHSHIRPRLRRVVVLDRLHQLGLVNLQRLDAFPGPAPDLIHGEHIRRIRHRNQYPVLAHLDRQQLMSLRNRPGHILQQFSVHLIRFERSLPRIASFPLPHWLLRHCLLRHTRFELRAFLGRRPSYHFLLAVRHRFCRPRDVMSGHHPTAQQCLHQVLTLCRLQFPRLLQLHFPDYAKRNQCACQLLIARY